MATIVVSHSDDLRVKNAKNACGGRSHRTAFLSPLCVCAIHDRRAVSIKVRRRFCVSFYQHRRTDESSHGGIHQVAAVEEWSHVYLSYCNNIFRVVPEGRLCSLSSNVRENRRSPSFVSRAATKIYSGLNQPSSRRAKRNLERSVPRTRSVVTTRFLKAQQTQTLVYGCPAGPTSSIRRKHVLSVVSNPQCPAERCETLRHAQPSPPAVARGSSAVPDR